MSMTTSARWEPGSALAAPPSSVPRERESVPTSRNVVLPKLAGRPGSRGP
ncbi:hypothetical protein HBB16_11370 [Pseudonocardia sp. MCCB 268]|nr:hypothetical protein [Pseudonocardia cytotoxica]